MLRPQQLITRANKTDGRVPPERSEDVDHHAPLADVFLVWAKDEQDVIRATSWKKASGPVGAEDRGKMSGARSITVISSWTSFRAGRERAARVSCLKDPLSCLTKRALASHGALGAAEFCWHAARTTHSSAAVRQSRWQRTSSVQIKLATHCKPKYARLHAVLRLGRLM